MEIIVFAFVIFSPFWAVEAENVLVCWVLVIGAEDAVALVSCKVVEAYGVLLVPWAVDVDATDAVVLACEVVEAYCVLLVPCADEDGAADAVELASIKAVEGYCALLAPCVVDIDVAVDKLPAAKISSVKV